MRIIHLTYTSRGGAGKAVEKFHHMLRKNDFQSAMINVEVEDHKANAWIVHVLKNPLRKLVNKIRYTTFRIYARLRYRRKKSYAFTYNYNYRGLTTNEIKKSFPFSPDIIFLHWISDFVMPSHIKELYQSLNVPLVWRYNDLAPATGGCHYTSGCMNYLTGCGNCPALSSTTLNDWSRKHLHEKQQMLKDIPLVVINSTHHTEQVFKSSPLFKEKRHEFIRNSINEFAFNVTGKQTARESAGIDTGKKIIFWGATYIDEPRKGFHEFVEALKILKGEGVGELYIIIGGNKRSEDLPAVPYPHHYAGLLTELDLAYHYKLADITAVSSLEDGGPMMIVESLMCGTPVVSFATGLALELVVTGKTGYKAEKGNSKDLAAGIRYILNLPANERSVMENNCHQLAKSLYSESAEIESYRRLFSELLQKK